MEIMYFLALQILTVTRRQTLTNVLSSHAVMTPKYSETSVIKIYFL